MKLVIILKPHILKHHIPETPTIARVWRTSCSRYSALRIHGARQKDLRFCEKLSYHSLKLRPAEYSFFRIPIRSALYAVPDGGPPPPPGESRRAVNIYVCVYIYIYACMYICISMCVCIYIYIHTHIHININI